MVKLPGFIYGFRRWKCEAGMKNESSGNYVQCLGGNKEIYDRFIPKLASHSFFFFFFVSTKLVVLLINCCQHFIIIMMKSVASPSSYSVFFARFFIYGEIILHTTNTRYLTNTLTIWRWFDFFGGFLKYRNTRNV